MMTSAEDQTEVADRSQQRRDPGVLLVVVPSHCLRSFDHQHPGDDSHVYCK